jgi:hypothetical protein
MPREKLRLTRIRLRVTLMRLAAIPGLVRSEKRVRRESPAPGSRMTAIANLFCGYPGSHPRWQEAGMSTVTMRDNIGTVHNAVGDYIADESHYMRRVQVMATLDYARLAV